MTNMHPTSPLDTTSQNTLLTTNHYLVELLLAFICCDLTLLRTFFVTCKPTRSCFQVGSQDRLLKICQDFQKKIQSLHPPYPTQIDHNSKILSLNYLQLFNPLVGLLESKIMTMSLNERFPVSYTYLLFIRKVLSNQTENYHKVCTTCLELLFSGTGCNQPLCQLCPPHLYMILLLT